MLKVSTNRPIRGGVLDVPLDDPSDWVPPLRPMGQLQVAQALLGDAEAGPFVVLVSDLPRTEPMHQSPGHGHGSDSWRISLLGTLRVGAQRYGPGRFRFQQGQVLYGADDLSWGPDGGYSIVIMADRRGTRSIAASPKDQPAFDAAGKLVEQALGCDIWSEFTGEQGVVTTLGPPRFGRIDGSFDDDWPEIAPGLGFVAGLGGDPERGPVILLTQAAPGTIAFPDTSFDTELMHVVVRGSAVHGDTGVSRYGVRMVESGAAPGAILAGPDGLCLATLIADRRSVPGALAGQQAALWDAMRTRVDGLLAALPSRTAA